MFLARTTLRGYVASRLAGQFAIRVAATCRWTLLYDQSRVLGGPTARLSRVLACPRLRFVLGNSDYTNYEVYEIITI